MNRFLFFFLCFGLGFSSSQAQQAFNTTLRSHVTFESQLNDIWGYVAPDGTEYALVGRRNGVSIVSLADPDNAVEVASIPGQNSIWRDLKTYGEYAYVVADQGTEGLTIIDLSMLPDSVSYTHNNLVVPTQQPLQRAHNLYIDVPTGLVYIAGSRQNSGGMLIYDVATNPGEALFVALAPNVYAHDVYVQDGVMYASEINIGRLGIYDVSNPQNITLLGARNTPFNFTHNAWSTANGNYVFTTDERANAPVGSYDISDPSEPILLDEFRPGRSLGSGVIPHNVHVIDQYLSTSYYTDGLSVADASVPDNIVEIAYYDTWTGPDGGFNGAWGAYPFLPSGLTLVTDITNGLYVVDVNYQRAARVKGTVRDADTGELLNDVVVELNGPQSDSDRSNAAGQYAAGVATAGAYTLTFNKTGYNSLTVNLTMENGVELVQDVVLSSSVSRFSIGGSVVSSLDASAVPGAQVVLFGENADYQLSADASGNLTLDFAFAGDYQVYAAQWGYQDVDLGIFTVEAGAQLNIQLVPGYQDGFMLDQGWTTSSTATSGHWERGVPNGTLYQGQPAAPGADIDGDVGNQAFVTGNAAVQGAGEDDVDDGVVTLRSPIFDATLYNNPQLNYHYWFFNEGGAGTPNDELRVEITNGNQTVLLANYRETTGEWMADSFLLADFIDLNDQMQLIVTTSDLPGSGHLVEAGFDGFSVSGELVSSSTYVAAALNRAVVFPNPSQGAFNLSYELAEQSRRAALRLEVFDQLGRLVLDQTLDKSGNASFGQPLGAGFYQLRLLQDGQLLYAAKLVKQ